MREMMMHHLDKQNRLTIPKKMRDYWEAQPDFNGRLVLYRRLSALRASTLENYRLLEHKLLVTKDPDMRDQAKIIIGSSIECQLDKKGRILLPRLMIEFLSPTQNNVWLIIRENILDIYSDNMEMHCLKDCGPINKLRVRCLFYYEKMIKMRIDTIIRMYQNPEPGMLEKEFQSIFYNSHLDLVPVLNTKGTIQCVIGIHRKFYTEGLHILVDKNTSAVVVSDIEAVTGVVKTRKTTVTCMLHTRRIINNNTDQISENCLLIEIAHNKTRALHKFIDMVPVKSIAKGICAISFYYYLIDEIHYKIEDLETRTCMEASYEYGKILKHNRLGMTQMLNYIQQTYPMIDERQDKYACRLKKLATDYRIKSQDQLAQAEDESYAASWNSGARSVEDMIIYLSKSK